MVMDYTAQGFANMVDKRMKSTGMNHKKAFRSVLNTWSDAIKRQKSIHVRNAKVQAKQREQAMKIGPKMRNGSTKTFARSTYGGKTVVQKVSDTRFNIYTPYYDEYADTKEIKVAQYKNENGSWNRNTNVVRDFDRNNRSFNNVQKTMFGGTSKRSRASAGGQGG